MPCRRLAGPSERERTQWYFQRYVEHLPAKGEIVLFDRSWYNRAGVEKVMGFCTPEQTQAFLNAAPEFERHLVDDGILLFKYWLCCDQDVQEERFRNRLNNPMKRWKLSPIDIKARPHYEDYTDARELMLAATHTEFAPWTLVDFNDQPTRPANAASRSSRPGAGHRAAACRHPVAGAGARAVEGALWRAPADSELPAGKAARQRPSSPSQEEG